MSKSPSTNTAASGLTTGAYVLAVVCLIVGIAIGYLVRGGPSQTAASVESATSAPAMPQGMGQGQVTPEQMKHMADQQVKPMLEELQKNQKNPELLAKIGNVYFDTQNYAPAIEYYKKSLALRENASVRTDLGTSIWYLGDADSALREFDTALKNDPKNVNAYFNMGVVKWQGKMDSQGAVAAWEKVLQIDPNNAQRSTVEGLIAQAKKHANIKPGEKTDKPAM